MVTGGVPTAGTAGPGTGRTAEGAPARPSASVLRPARATRRSHLPPPHHHAALKGAHQPPAGGSRTPSHRFPQGSQLPGTYGGVDRRSDVRTSRRSGSPRRALHRPGSELVSCVKTPWRWWSGHELEKGLAGNFRSGMPAASKSTPPNAAITLSPGPAGEWKDALIPTPLFGVFPRPRQGV